MSKRIFDIVFSILAIVILTMPLCFIWIGAALDTKTNGVFLQQRIGQFGKPFRIFKFRSIQVQDNSISNFGRYIRKSKLDELPQLFNVLIGDMSIVGPRPDVAGYYDALKGENKLILNLKPGLTSEAALKYRYEELVLESKNDPIKYNDEIIFPDKVRMNLDYYFKQSFLGDLKIIFNTVRIIFSKGSIE